MVERRQLHMHTRNFIFLFFFLSPPPLFFLHFFFGGGGGATAPTAYAPDLFPIPFLDSNYVNNVKYNIYKNCKMNLKSGSGIM